MTSPADNPLEKIQRARIEGRYSDVADLIPEETRGSVLYELWFPTIISFMDIKYHKTLNKKWISQILKWRDKDQKGIVRSNSQGWHSTVDMHTRKEFIPMGMQFLSQAEEVAKRMGLDESAEPIIVNMWANVSQCGAYNRNHTHPSTFLSLAYYLQAPPGCGKICFTDPRAQAGVLELPYSRNKPKTNEMLREISYEPIPGRCIMFPSWLAHEVQPNLTKLKGDEGLRISVSANIFFRMKAGAIHVPKGHDNKGILTKDGEILDARGLANLNF